MFLPPIRQVIPVAIETVKEQLRTGRLLENNITAIASLNLLQHFLQNISSLTAYDKINAAILDSITPTNDANLFCHRTLSNEPILINQCVLLLICDLQNTGFMVKDFIGSHNQKIFHAAAYNEETHHKLIIPFELITTLVGTLGSVEKNYAFINNPLHPCFCHQIKAAPVMGVAVGGDINRLIAYVTNPELLRHYLAALLPNEKDIAGRELEYDTYTAMSLLKHRYGVDIADSIFKKLEKVERDLQKHASGQVVLELHDD